MTISCSHKNKNNSTELQLCQILSQLMFSQLESEGHLLNFEVTIEDSINFSKEVEILPKFVFFHSELNCNSCVEENLTLINDFCNDIGIEYVLFLGV